jgi:formylglycine-generating enzyme required for sulfatase activity
MSFSYRGALSPTSPLFRGRDAELARLAQLCRDEVNAYVIVYGGRQHGKTSLLLRLEAVLRAERQQVCMVDFQGLPGATTIQALTHLAEHIADSVPLAPDLPSVTTWPTLLRFLVQALNHDEVPRLALLLDELGTLPESTRKDLANVLRALFTERLRSPALAKLQVVLVGGIELFNLVTSQVSTLHGVCEEIYLDDLSQADVVGLVADSLAAAGVAREQAAQIGLAIYGYTAGQPYLTQRLGAFVVAHARPGTPVHARLVEEGVEEVLRHDPLLRHLCDGITDHHLESAVLDLAHGSQRFSRLNDPMAQLELLGLAIGRDGHWRVRSRLLEVALREWLSRREVEYPNAQVSDVPPPVSERISASVLPITSPPTAGPQTVTTKQQGSEAFMSLPDWAPELVDVPAGPFLMGSSDVDEQADIDEKPQHELTLPAFWIGKTPITNAQWRHFLETDGYTNRRYWTNAGWKFQQEQKIRQPVYWEDPRYNADDQPVVGVSWYEAVAYCRWLSKITKQEFYLPSEAEWEKAARGPRGRIYPWGNKWRAKCCNNDEAGIRRPSPVGSFPKGASPYGALDMAGNVWEWCATKYGKPYPYDISEDEWAEIYLEGTDARRLRGGTWYDDRTSVRGTSRGRYDPRYRLNLIGMRVASHSPRPNAES